MVPAEAAHDTIEALGDVGLLQFKDLNTHKSAFQRTYANQVPADTRLLPFMLDIPPTLQSQHLPLTVMWGLTSGPSLR